MDIEKFVTDYLKYQNAYDNIAEEDAGKTAFLGDGKASLCVWRDGKRVRAVRPPTSL